MTGLEIETKLQISSKDFARVLEEGDIVDRVEQLNVYFDQQQELSQSASTFRIRLYGAGKAPVMTLKIPVARKGFGQGEPRRALEIEQTIEPAERCARPREVDVQRDLPTEFSEVLLDLGVRHLERLGTMRTWRHIVKFSDGLTIEADRVRLPSGDQFYEIEFESDDASLHDQVKAKIQSLVSSSYPSGCSKYERFIQCLSEDDIREAAEAPA